MKRFSFRRKRPGACLVRTVPTVVVAAALSIPVLAQNAQQQRSTAERMTGAAHRFIETLDADRRAMAVLPFDDEERYNFHFVPRARNGLPLKQMTQQQRIAAHDLLRSALSSQGYLKVTSVIQLERVLEILEGSARRDRELYFVTVFGEPGEDAPWGWRFEGHHLSLNYTSVTGVTVATPTFFGANPGEVRSGPGAGLRVLAAEEDLGRQLIRMLPSDRRDRAIIASAAPDEIITGADREARLERFEGLPVTDMTEAERGVLQRLILEYLHNMPEDIAEEQFSRIEEAFDALWFAWAGPLEPGAGHYYRIHGPTVLFEYDNTQNGANHVHSIWRDLENDFGGDLLRRHYDERAHD